MNDILSTQLGAIAAMFSKAREIGSRGVALACIMPAKSAGQSGQQMNPSIIIVDRFQREPYSDSGDNGTNYLAVVMSKFAEMMDTHQNSGTTMGLTPKKGELNLIGGIVEKSGDSLIFAAFSGGAPNDDVAVAWAGIEELRKFRPFDYS